MFKERKVQLQVRGLKIAREAESTESGSEEQDGVKEKKLNGRFLLGGDFAQFGLGLGEYGESRLIQDGVHLVQVGGELSGRLLVLLAPVPLQVALDVAHDWKRGNGMKRVEEACDDYALDTVLAKRMLTLCDALGERVVQLREERAEGAFQRRQQVLHDGVLAGGVHGADGCSRRRLAVRVDDGLVLRDVRQQLDRRRLERRLQLGQLRRHHRLQLLAHKVRRALFQRVHLALQLRSDRRLQLVHRLKHIIPIHYFPFRDQHFKGASLLFMPIIVLFHF